MKNILTIICAAMTIFNVSGIAAGDDSEHLRKFADGVAGDKTVDAAGQLNIQVPVMCREWHVWWRAPHGSHPHTPEWFHWNGQRMFGKYDSATTIEQTIEGSAWRRYLNCTGYPLLGPYDSGQPDIIRWQLETAKNAGLECLHIHLWPSLWDEGREFTPITIFDQIMETAAAMSFPVAVHDEIQFRRPPITKAQQLDNSIERSILLLKKYGRHPGWYKIDGMPVYYFQNWAKWISAQDMGTYFKTVEQRIGFPVYWIVEMSDIEEYFKIPEVKAVVSHSNLWFLHTSPFGKGPHPWETLLKTMQRSARLARKHNKKFGVIVANRFNHTHDRGEQSKPKIISAEDGMFLVNSLKKSMETKPDFIVLMQWNDFEESAFIEPAWDFDGFNGDPYRYCRIVAAAMNKKFTPAPLPKRTQVDPFIRRKLYGGLEKGDMGPVFQKPVLSGSKLTVRWTEGSTPDHVRIIQGKLGRWTPGIKTFDSRAGLRQANYSIGLDAGAISGKEELRLYAPGMVSSTPGKSWLGIRAYHTPETKLTINYRAWPENYRRDSVWRRATANLGNGYKFQLPDKTVFYWTPLHNAQFAGLEGDITISLGGSKAKTYIREVLLWTPDMEEIRLAPADAMQLPGQIDANSNFVAVAYDKLGNPGQPMLIMPDSVEESLQTPDAVNADGDMVETFTGLTRWKKTSGKDPVLVEYAPENKYVPFLSLNNSQIAAELPRPMKTLNLKIDMRQNRFSRAQWVAVFDQTGKKGLGFMWDSATEKMFNGQGFMAIIRFDLDAPVNFASGFSRMTPPLGTGISVNAGEMAEFKLEITGTSITLSCGDKSVKADYSANEEFSQVVIRGHDTGFFDNLRIKAQE